MPVAIKGTGGGSVTLSAAAAATDTTLTLPNTTGTVALTAGPTFTGTVTATTITSPSATALTIQSAGTTAMTVDTSQNVGIGTTTALSSSRITVNGSATAGTPTIVSDKSAAGSVGSNHVLFNNSNGYVGSITTSGSATSFNTSSDYRLKKSVALMTTGLATVSALKPVTYKWNADNSDGEGFIAHELQSVIPHAVTGDKDAVDEEGNIKPQGVDYSKIVVHLVAAIQELEARLAALETK
jgi:hypothetical protein